MHRIQLRKNKPNTTNQDIRPGRNLQADDELIIRQEDLYIISWETNFYDFPTHSDLKDTSDDPDADSDQQDAIITTLDLRSTRRDKNTDTVAPNSTAARY